MKIVLPKTLAEPLTIPWEEITSGEERQVDLLLSSLMDEMINQDMDEMLERITERLREKTEHLMK